MMRKLFLYLRGYHMRAHGWSPTSDRARHAVSCTQRPGEQAVLRGDRGRWFWEVWAR